MDRQFQYQANRHLSEYTWRPVVVPRLSKPIVLEAIPTTLSCAHGTLQTILDRVQIVGWGLATEYITGLASPHQPPFTTSCVPQAMESKHYEKDVDTPSVNSLNAPAAPKYEFYDPSKESVWTRMGLTAESFKRAPGTTGCASSFSHFLGQHAQLDLFSSGQHIAGANNLEDLDRVRADAPMLQQKMKPRHLQMIAVGMSCGLLTIGCECS